MVLQFLGEGKAIWNKISTKVPVGGQGKEDNENKVGHPCLSSRHPFIFQGPAMTSPLTSWPPVLLPCILHTATREVLLKHISVHVT